MPKTYDDAGIVLVQEDSHLKALYFAKLPHDLVFAGELFKAKEETLGEYDYLRNENDELIGFSINFTSRETKTLTALATVCGDITIDNRQVRFILGRGLARGVGVQIPTMVYRSASDRILVGFYQWGDFGKLGFPLHSNGV